MLSDDSITWPSARPSPDRKPKLLIHAMLHVFIGFDQISEVIVLIDKVGHLALHGLQEHFELFPEFPKLLFWVRRHDRHSASTAPAKLFSSLDAFGQLTNYELENVADEIMTHVQLS